MMKDRTRKREGELQEPGGRNLEPRESQVHASQAFASTFDRIREESDELLRLKLAAAREFATTPASECEGLSRLLDVLLPRDATRQGRIARALAFEQAVLERLRGSTVDPLEVDPRPLTALARLMDLDYPTFWLLAQRDHERMGGRSGVRARNHRSPSEVEAAFRSAWERDTLDDASPA